MARQLRASGAGSKAWTMMGCKSSRPLFIRHRSPYEIMKITLLPITACALLLVFCGCHKPKSSHVKTVSDVTNSRNNLIQISIAFRIWAGDNNGQFPFNVSQSQGGTRELCHRDSNGFEKNPAPTFMALSNGIASVKILVCRNDETKKPAADFASITTANISYQLRTGADVSLDHPSEILAVDPINDLVLYCDGKVAESNH
jgi:hypothetical protein